MKLRSWFNSCFITLRYLELNYLRILSMKNLTSSDKPQKTS